MPSTLVAVAILGVLQNGFALLQFSTTKTPCSARC
jgi:hypothetical protein